MLLLAFILFSFWYLVIEGMTAAAGSAGFESMLTDYASALVAVALGLAAGCAFALARSALALRRAEAELKAGDARDGAHVSLGKLPVVRHRPPTATTRGGV